MWILEPPEIRTLEPMKYLLLLSLTVMLSACMSTMTVYRPGTASTNGEKGSTKKSTAHKALAFSGDITGRFKLRATPTVVEMETFDVPPDAPMGQRLVTDKKGNVVGVETFPVVAGYSNSKATDALFGGINKVIRAGSNFIGTVFTGLAGWEAAKGLTEVGVASVNAASRTSVSGSKDAAKVALAKESTKVSLAEIKATPALPAANSTIQAATPATVVPVAP
jgi:hypothetical protein